MASIVQQHPRYNNTKTDAIIVVTGGAHRINAALDLLAKDKADQLFISGVNKNVSLHNLLDIWGGDRRKVDCCITLGKTAINTDSNAHEARSWLADKNVHSLRLVTSDYHMARTLLAFRHKIPDILIIPYPVKSKDTGLNSMAIGFYEYNKTLLTLLWYIMPYKG